MWPSPVLILWPRSHKQTQLQLVLSKFPICSKLYARSLNILSSSSLFVSRNQLKYKANYTSCQADNCLRQLEKASKVAAPFCATYTAYPNTVMAGLPDDVSNCANTAEISSACSCIMTDAPPAVTAHAVELPLIAASLDCQADNCLRQLEKASSVIAPFCATYTTAFNTHTTGLPEEVSNCASDSYAISSACSCIMTKTIPSPIAVIQPVTTTATSVVYQTFHETTTIIMTITAALPAPEIPSPTLVECQPDACLSQLESRFPTIAPFCAEYTKTPHTAPPIPIPSKVLPCKGNHAAISSACSCVMRPLPDFTAATIPGPHLIPHQGVGHHPVDVKVPTAFPAFSSFDEPTAMNAAVVFHESTAVPVSPEIPHEHPGTQPKGWSWPWSKKGPSSNPLNKLSSLTHLLEDTKESVPGLAAPLPGLGNHAH